MNPHASARQAGFTLIELIVVLVIIVIVATIALPSFNNTVISNRMSAQSNELVASLSLARTLAIQQNSGGGICAANDSLTGCGGSWDNGWVVWIDENRNNNVEATEVRRTGNVKVGDQLSGASDIRFDGRGRRILPGAAVDTRVEIRPAECVSGENFLRTVSVSVVGSVTSEKGNCS